MKADARISSSGDSGQLFPALAGAFLGLAFLKFGNPPIMEKWVAVPANIYEFILNSPWPIGWAYLLLCLLGVAALKACRWRAPAKRWPLALLLLWLTWQFVAALRSVDMSLTAPTLAHFLVCFVFYCLGCFCLSSPERLAPLFAGLVIAFLLVLVAGFQQQFGGLEQTRRYFFLYIYPELKEVSPEYLKKISSPRIFSTLFYPNAFAGALLLLFPTVVVVVAGAKRLFSFGARCFLVGSITLATLACLVWSGSKGGWLLMLLMALIALLRLKFDRWLKIGIVALVLAVGMTGFALKYLSFFRKGATSVVARFDYWHAAIRTANAHPWVGTGPGTFSRPYQVLKRPESEMARLTHNDYLEQASDSGWLGLLTYTGFIMGSLILTYPRRAGEAGGTGRAGEATAFGWSLERLDWLRFAVWLGALGWALQGLFEFGLYIPALSWSAFCFLGLLTPASSAAPSSPVARRSPRRDDSLGQGSLRRRSPN